MAGAFVAGKIDAVENLSRPQSKGELLSQRSYEQEKVFASRTAIFSEPGTRNLATIFGFLFTTYLRLQHERRFRSQRQSRSHS